MDDADDFAQLRKCIKKQHIVQLSAIITETDLTETSLISNIQCNTNKRNKKFWEKHL